MQSLPLQKMMDKDGLSVYLISCGRNHQCAQYIITEDFEELSEKMKGYRLILLQGPKGCGKSTMLIAMYLTMVNTDNKCLYLSSEILRMMGSKSYGTSSYFNGFVHKNTSTINSITLLESLNKSVDEFVTAFCGYLEEFCSKEKLCLFIDFCQLQRVNSLIIQHLVSISLLKFENLSLVIALSSGVVSYQDDDIKRLIEDKEAVSLVINGFTREEAKKYVELQKTKLTYHNIASISGTNPLLLSLLHKTDTYQIYAAKVRRKVSDFLSQNLKFEGETIKKFLLDKKLKSCLNFVYCALYGEELDEEVESAYRDSWLNENNVMILDNKKLQLNFPAFGPLMIQALRNCLVENSSIMETLITKEASVRGFVFEAQFFQCCEKEGKLCLSCVSVTNQKKIDVSLLISSVGNLQFYRNSLTVNALYEMSSCYPLLDFVGSLTDKNGTCWLVFLQLSLQRYDKHASICGIFKKQKYTPKEVNDSSFYTIYSYYKNLAGIKEADSSAKVIIGYISPQELEFEDRILPDLQDEIKLVRKNQEMYVGIVQKHSTLYSMILQFK